MVKILLFLLAEPRVVRADVGILTPGVSSGVCAVDDIRLRLAVLAFDRGTGVSYGSTCSAEVFWEDWFADVLRPLCAGVFDGCRELDLCD